MFSSDIETIDQRRPAGTPACGLQVLSHRELKEVIGGGLLSADTTSESRILPDAKHFDPIVGIDVHVIAPGN